MQTHSCLMVNNNQPEHRKVAGISLTQRGFALFREAGTPKSLFGTCLFHVLQATQHVAELGR